MRSVAFQLVNCSDKRKVTFSISLINTLIRGDYNKLLIVTKMGHSHYAIQHAIIMTIHESYTMLQC